MRYLITILITIQLLSLNVYCQVTTNESYDLKFSTNEYNEWFGKCVEANGDLNGDGFDDIVISAFNYPGGQGKGKVFIYWGGPNMDNVVDLSLYEPASSARFGISIANVGDVNEDGYSDLIVGGDGYDNFTGRAYVYFGGTTMDSIADLIFKGEKESSGFGWSVSGAGDINGDGKNDIIVGTRYYSGGPDKAYCFLGGSNIDTIPDIVYRGYDNSEFGWSVSGAGDINNDGFDDLLISAPAHNSDNGMVSLYLGGSVIDSISDINFFGSNGERFGTAISGAGDLNSDGYSDILIGAPEYNNYIGRTYIYHGGNDMDNVSDLQLTGSSGNRNFGYFVTSIGDINFDNFSDIAIGSPYCISGDIGKAFVFYGGNSMDTNSDIQFDGEDRDYGYSISSGDINNDGGVDIIIGDALGDAYLYYGTPNTTSVELINSSDLYKIINVFPNPIIQENLEITIDDVEVDFVQIEIYSILGTKVYSKTEKSNRISVSLDNIPSSSYVLKIIYKNKYFDQKIIKL